MAINMKKIITFFATTILLIIIGGCADNRNGVVEPKGFLDLIEPRETKIVDSTNNDVTIDEKELIEPRETKIVDSTNNNATINAKEFMQKSEQVVQETLEIGPVISKSTQVENVETKRIFVSREEVADYTSINKQHRYTGWNF